MKKILSLILAGLLLLSLAACGGGEEDKGPEKDVSLYESGDGFETINDPLTWDAINAFPVVHDGMTIEEGKELVVDFFRFCKTAVWIPDDVYEYKIKTSNEKTEVIDGYVKYGGLPYISLASGSIYRLMDYMDPETHVVDIKAAGLNPKLFGNQCSFGSYWGIGRAINSAKYAWTTLMVPNNGFIPVGDYEIKEGIESYKNGIYNTVSVLEENGAERMYEAYTGLKAGDVIVYYTTAGHVVMISGDAVVERDAEGKVDPTKSYVTVIDQTPGHSTTQNAAGDTFNFENNVDAKWTFDKLFRGNYVPYTFAEWLGTDPLESSVTTFDYEGDSISMTSLSGKTITSNYGISDIYAAVYHSNGKEVYKLAIRATETSVKELRFSTKDPSATVWGDLETLNPKGEYTMKVFAQISTGERPVLWEGKFIPEQ